MILNLEVINDPINMGNQMLTCPRKTFAAALSDSAAVVPRVTLSIQPIFMMTHCKMNDRVINKVKAVRAYQVL